MPGVPTFLKCNLINYVSHEKKFLCGRNQKKKKSKHVSYPKWGHKIHRFWLTRGSKMLKFYPKEGQSLKVVWGLTSKKTFCLPSVVSEG